MGKIYLGCNEELQRKVEGVFTRRAVIPVGGAEDFVLDALECKDPRCVELVVGHHLEIGVDYDALVRRASERGMVNPTGWLLEQAKYALQQLNEDIPQGLDTALQVLRGRISKVEYNITPIARDFYPRIDETSKRWNVIAPYSIDAIVRGVRWACQDKKKLREQTS